LFIALSDILIWRWNCLLEAEVLASQSLDVSGVLSFWLIQDIFIILRLRCIVPAWTLENPFPRILVAKQLSKIHQSLSVTGRLIGYSYWQVCWSVLRKIWISFGACNFLNWLVNISCSSTVAKHNTVNPLSLRLANELFFLLWDKKISCGSICW